MVVGLLLPLLVVVAGCGGGGKSCPSYVLEPAISNDPGDVFRQCGPVDIVIVMDTSGSMDDEAEGLCESLDGIISELTGFGLTELRLLKWGITQDGTSDQFSGTGEFACLTDNVRDVFGDPEVPGIPGRLLDESESDEDWGHAVAIVSEYGSDGDYPNFQWRADAIRIIIPISDEGPDLGSPPDTPDDTAAITNAISFAKANGVIVAPIIAAEAEPETAEHGRRLAEETGGMAVRSTDQSITMGQLIYDIVFVACGGTLDQPAAPGSPGSTMLVTAGRDGGVYSLNTSTGSASLIVGTPISGGGTGEVLTHVSSLVYNEEVSRLWAGTGGQADNYGSIYRIDASGLATFLADDTDEADAIAGLTQHRATRSIFGMEGDHDDVLAINNLTGTALEFADSIGDINESGNALTFVGDRLYLASGEELLELDTFSGEPTKVADLTLTGFPSSTDVDFNIISMTTRPSDNTVFAILMDQENSGKNTYLCTINLSTGLVTNIGPTGPRVGGIAWVPVGYFNSN